MPLRVIGHPVYAGGLLIVYSGDGSGARYMLAIDPDKKEPAKVWELKKKDTPYVPCVLPQGDRLLWIGDKGTVTCADAKTGKVVWAESVFENASVSASPILIGDKLLVVSERGEVAVVKAGEKFEEVSKAPLGEPAFATPAFADGRAYVRTVTSLYCFGKK